MRFYSSIFSIFSLCFRSYAVVQMVAQVQKNGFSSLKSVVNAGRGLRSFLLFGAACMVFAVPTAKAGDAPAKIEPTKTMNEAVENAAGSAGFSESQKKDIDQMIHDYIMKNPEVMMESVKKYQEDQEVKRQQDSIAVLKENSDFFYKNAALPQAGNAKGDITIVEFFDYNCGYCKHAFSTVQKLLESDKNLNFRFVEFPILSEQSNLAAKWALAANKQGKYWEFHQKVITLSGPKSEEGLSKVAQEVGLDVEKLKKDANSDEIKNLLIKNHEMAQKLNISGTPAFIVGDQIFRGYIEDEQFKSLIETERAARKDAKK